MDDELFFAKDSITIIQSDNRQIFAPLDNETGYESFSVVNNYLYAMEHGHDYAFYHWNTPNHSTAHENMHSTTKYQQVCGGRAAPWCKIISAFHAINKTKENDWILMIDSDVVFRNTNQSLELW